MWKSPIANATEANPTLLCIHCGYTLDHVDAPACPECGTPVQTSRDGDWLHLAAPEYLQTIRRGTRLVSKASGTLFVLAALCVLVPILVGFILPNNGPIVIALFMSIAIVPIPILFILVLAGWFLIAAPDHRFDNRELPSSSRIWTRRLAVIASAAWLALFAMLVIFPHTSGPTTNIFVNLLINGVFTLQCVVVTIATLHVRLLARRLNSRRLAKICTHFTYVMAAAAAVIILNMSRLLPAGPLYSALSLAAGVLAISYYWSVVIEFGKTLKKLAPPAA